MSSEISSETLNAVMKSPADTFFANYPRSFGSKSTKSRKKTFTRTCFFLQKIPLYTQEAVLTTTWNCFPEVQLFKIKFRFSLDIKIRKNIFLKGFLCTHRMQFWQTCRKFFCRASNPFQPKVWQISPKKISFFREVFW